MKKNNRGAALAYSLMLTMVVFSICAMVLTLALSQVTSSNTYAKTNELEDAYTRIGELYFEFEASDHSDSFEGEVQSFMARIANEEGYAVTQLSDATAPIKWLIESEDHSFVLVFSLEEGTNTKRLTIKSKSENMIYLFVGISGDGKLIQWAGDKSKNDKTEEAE